MNKNNKETLKEVVKKLFSSLKNYLPYIGISLVLLLISSFLSVKAPTKLKEITDLIISSLRTKIPLKEIKTLVLFLVVIYFLSTLLHYIANLILVTVSNKFGESLRNKVIAKINRLPLKYFDNHMVGDTLSRVTNDVNTISFTLDECIGGLGLSIFLLVGTFLMMVKTNFIMSLVAIFSSLLPFILIVLITKKSQKYFDQNQERLGNISSHVEETYSYLSTVKAYNGQKETEDTFNKLNMSLAKSNFKSRFYSRLMFSLMHSLEDFSFLVVAISGSLLVMKGDISYGVIVAFIAYIKIFAGELSSVSEEIGELQRLLAASKRVFSFLEQEELKEQEVKVVLDPHQVKGEVVFSHINFSYQKDKPIIKDFSLNVKPGEKIAIVGKTGAGKTTLVNLLMRFYDLSSGFISIDGVDIKDLSRKNVHDLFIMVLQDTWLFNGTIRENLKFNNYSKDDQEIEKILKVLGLNHFVKTLPGGLDYKIEDNETISLGQKQLLTIARGMIKNAPLLILDEATSSVDTRTEDLVQKAMDNLMKGRTSFIIAHRLSTIINADKILVIEEGKIVEEGNHEELLRKKGKYYELYNSQFLKVE